jgi:ribonuclease Z
MSSSPSVRITLSPSLSFGRAGPQEHAQRFSKVVFLGTAASIPSPGKRNVSSLAIVYNDGSITLVDVGEATQHQIMLCPEITMSRIDRILITHLHGDHVWGIFGLLATMAAGGRKDSVVVCGPEGIADLLEGVFSICGGFRGFELRVMELSDKLGCLQFGLLVAVPMKHTVPAIGFVICEESQVGKLDIKKAASLGVKAGKDLGALKQGKNVTLEDGKVVHSADCIGQPTPGRRITIFQDTCDSSIGMADAMDSAILIHECTYDASMIEKAITHGHSTSIMAGRCAASMNAQMLILTHFSNRYSSGEGNVSRLVAEADSVFNKPVHAASDFSVFTSTNDGTFIPVAKE